MSKNIKKIQKITLAMAIAPRAIPVNPNSPATKAITSNIIIHSNMIKVF